MLKRITPTPAMIIRHFFRLYDGCLIETEEGIVYLRGMIPFRSGQIHVELKVSEEGYQALLNHMQDDRYWLT